MSISASVRPSWIALIGCLFLVACSPSAPTAAASAAPSPTNVPAPTAAGALVTQAAQMVGIWQVDDPHCQEGFMLVRPDGTYTWSCNRDGSNGVSGKYTLENGRFAIQNDYCEGRQYEVRDLSAYGTPGPLVFTIVKDDCPTIEDHLMIKPAIWLGALP